MKVWNKSTTKFEYEINEDSAISNIKNKYVAVSDGAGGGGVYADRWSKYLCEKLPHDAIDNFKELDSWIDSIWEQFYNQHEEMAKQEGGLFLQKFYEEGAFATLAAVWIVNNDYAKWVTYGDSVVFVYNKINGTLFSSIANLSEFNKPPFLIGTNSPLIESGFKSGIIHIHSGDYVFCTSDALAHFILMLYQLSSHDYDGSIQEAMSCQTRNSQLIRIAKESNMKFDKCINKLLQASLRKDSFNKYMSQLYNQGVVALDDYTISAIFIE